MEDLVKMSPKGQLVVPKEIRQKEHFKTSDRFIAFGFKGGVLFKRVAIPNVKIEFESLSKEVTNQMKEKDIKRKEVSEAVKWTRQK